MMSTDYYVYVYKDPNTLEPFYVGKGKGYRATQHTNPSGLTRVNHKTNKIKKLLNQGTPPTVEYIEEYLTEEEAFTIERALIAQYGRVDNGTGILLNGTDGGEGTSGREKTEDEIEAIRERSRVAPPWSRMTEEQKVRAKALISASTTARNLANNPSKRDDVRAKMSAARKGMVGNMTGKKHTVDTLVKLSTIAKNRQKVNCEFCNKSHTPSNHIQFHGENCKHNPNVSIELINARQEKQLTASMKAREKLHCTHCNQWVGRSPFARFHGDKCKSITPDIEPTVPENCN